MIFPSNRGGYCIQPQKREYSMNYKCSFPGKWLGLEMRSLCRQQDFSVQASATRGGFLMTAGTLEDAVAACKISLSCFKEEPVIVNFGGGKKRMNSYSSCQEWSMRAFHTARCRMSRNLRCREFTEKLSWKSNSGRAGSKDQVKQILKRKTGSCLCGRRCFLTYPVVHQLRKNIFRS